MHWRWDGCTWSHLWITIFLSQSAKFHYHCDNNIRNDINFLTSSYYENQVDTNNKIIKKPSGKCSHGGYGDPSADKHAKGGINKDSPFKQWSPHNSLHYMAAEIAEQATIKVF